MRTSEQNPSGRIPFPFTAIVFRRCEMQPLYQSMSVGEHEESNMFGRGCAEFDGYDGESALLDTPRLMLLYPAIVASRQMA